MLVGNIPDFSQTDAYRVMQKAHKSGMAVVGVWVFEVAEACLRPRVEPRPSPNPLKLGKLLGVDHPTMLPAHRLRPSEIRWAHRVGHRGGRLSSCFRH